MLREEIGSSLTQSRRGRRGETFGAYPSAFQRVFEENAQEQAPSRPQKARNTQKRAIRYGTLEFTSPNSSKTEIKRKLR